MSSSPDAESAAADADAGLLDRLASGDRDALDALYRRHEDYARRVATAVSGGDLVVADDLMAEAFAAVFRRAASNAPILNFRAYLSACIRNAHLAHVRAVSHVSPASDQPWLFEAAVDDPYLVDGIVAEHAIAALATLPAGWRELLWRVEVEGRTNAELADLMGKSHTAVSSMTHRAREGLRRAFLEHHVPATRASACRWTRQHLSRYVRSDLSERAAHRVQTHVSECAACARVLQDLESLNRRIGVSMWPVVLVAAGPSLPVLPNADGSSTPSPDASSVTSASPSMPPPAGPLAALTGASPVTIAAVVGVAAAAALAAGAVAIKLTGQEGGPAGQRSVVAADGAAEAPDRPPPAADPPADPLAQAAAPLSSVKAEQSEDDEEEDEVDKQDDEDTDSPRRPTPTTPPPTYDASIASVDKSSVTPDVDPEDLGAFEQSLTFAVSVDSASPRTGTVLDLAITIDDPQFSVEQVSGSGWVCRIQPDGQNLEDYLGNSYVFDPGTTVICSYEFPNDTAPPSLEWDLEIADADGVTGSAQVSVVGKNDPNGSNDAATF